jgi:hypothetical protein
MGYTEIFSFLLSLFFERNPLLFLFSFKPPKEQKLSFPASVEFVGKVVIIVITL